MSIGERIKIRRLELNLSQDELAQKIGYKSRSSINKIELGITDINQSKILKFAKALETTPAFLMGLIDDPDPTNIMHGIKTITNQIVSDKLKATEDKIIDEVVDNICGMPYNPTHRIPILGYISAGQPLYAEEHIEGYTFTELNGGAEYFALRVKGDSMNAVNINDGNTVIVRKQDIVENGEIAVVNIDEENATIKRFYINDNTVTLIPQSTNPIHLPQIYDTEKHSVRVCGKVVRCFTDF